ncbi:glutathione S-transferase [Panacagrimonas perspica]|uniref:Glutathione S-transferase n=1 Tax=Panacagrimonas perspica TaxID=381431 RepID=A0A4R7PGY2_9GAMM|nr:glutathione S-transferase [Panacagrimonas perspica]TDU32670.1 glutathione S-transferase [Panacagrimonas perspica]THD05556.1 glutathione S-transferase [Panacagrimonas perspica]
MKLYHHPLSGHSHRARLLLSLLQLDHELELVDLMAGAQKSPAFLALNRFGQVPVLDDAGTVIADSNAILVYLAKKYDAQHRWLPETPVGAAAVERWLSVAAGQIAFGPGAARLITLFGAKLNAAEVIARAHQVLKLIDTELSGRSFILGEVPTIADVSLYSYISSAPEGNVDLSAYHEVNAWLRRIEGLPGFVAFQKSTVGLSD